MANVNEASAHAVAVLPEPQAKSGVAAAGFYDSDSEPKTDTLASYPWDSALGTGVGAMIADRVLARSSSDGGSSAPVQDLPVRLSALRAALPTEESSVLFAALEACAARGVQALESYFKSRGESIDDYHWLREVRFGPNYPAVRIFGTLLRDREFIQRVIKENSESNAHSTIASDESEVGHNTLESMGDFFIQQLTTTAASGDETFRGLRLDGHAYSATELLGSGRRLYYVQRLSDQKRQTGTHDAMRLSFNPEALDTWISSLEARDKLALLFCTMQVYFFQHPDLLARFATYGGNDRVRKSTDEAFWQKMSAVTAPVTRVDLVGLKITDTVESAEKRQALTELIQADTWRKHLTDPFSMEEVDRRQLSLLFQAVMSGEVRVELIEVKSSFVGSSEAGQLETRSLPPTASEKREAAHVLLALFTTLATSGRWLQHTEDRTMTSVQAHTATRIQRLLRSIPGLANPGSKTAVIWGRKDRGPFVGNSSRLERQVWLMSQALGKVLQCDGVSSSQLTVVAPVLRLKEGTLHPDYPLMQNQELVQILSQAQVTTFAMFGSGGLLSKLSKQLEAVLNRAVENTA